MQKTMLLLLLLVGTFAPESGYSHANTSPAQFKCEALPQDRTDETQFFSCASLTIADFRVTLGLKNIQAIAKHSYDYMLECAHDFGDIESSYLSEETEFSGTYQENSVSFETHGNTCRIWGIQKYSLTSRKREVKITVQPSNDVSILENYGPRILDVMPRYFTCGINTKNTLRLSMICKEQSYADSFGRQALSTGMMFYVNYNSPEPIDEWADFNPGNYTLRCSVERMGQGREQLDPFKSFEQMDRLIADNPSSHNGRVFISPRRPYEFTLAEQASVVPRCTLLNENVPSDLIMDLNKWNQISINLAWKTNLPQNIAQDCNQRAKHERYFWTHFNEGKVRVILNFDSPEQMILWNRDTLVPMSVQGHTLSAIAPTLAKFGFSKEIEKLFNRLVSVKDKLGPTDPISAGSTFFRNSNLNRLPGFSGAHDIRNFIGVTSEGYGENTYYATHESIKKSLEKIVDYDPTLNLQVAIPLMNATWPGLMTAQQIIAAHLKGILRYIEEHPDAKGTIYLWGLNNIQSVHVHALKAEFCRYATKANSLPIENNLRPLGDFKPKYFVKDLALIDLDIRQFIGLGMNIPRLISHYAEFDLPQIKNSFPHYLDNFSQTEEGQKATRVIEWAKRKQILEKTRRATREELVAFSAYLSADEGQRPTQEKAVEIVFKAE